MPETINQKIQSKQQDLTELISTLRSIAISSLAKIYRTEERLFTFQLRKNSHYKLLVVIKIFETYSEDKVSRKLVYIDPV